MKRAVLITISLAAGCAVRATQRTQVILPPLPPGTSFEVRYARLGAARGVRVDKDSLGFSLNRPAYGAPYILIGNGQKVYDIEDLEPQVAIETEVGRMLVEHRRAVARGRRVDLVGIGGIAAGAALAGLGALAIKSDHNTLAAVPISLGVVAFFGGIGYWVFADRGPSVDVRIDDRMLERYNASLAETLELCVTPLQVTDCARVRR